MPEEKVKEKTPDKEEETTEEEEDEFSDLFDDPDEEKEEDSEEDDEVEEEKPAKKKTPIKKQSRPNNDANERLEAMEKRIERRADVTDFFATDRGKMFSKYREKIAKAAIDPRFIGIPVSKLPQLILKDSAYEKVLADARKEADDEAADSVIGGSSRKSVTPEELSKIDPTSMSKDEFAKLKSRALRGEFKIKSK